MTVKCPKCGSLDTKIADYNDLAKVLNSVQCHVLSSSGVICKEEIDIDWTKIWGAIIAALAAIISTILGKLLGKEKPKKELYIVCNSCHQITKLDGKTYNN